MNVERWIGTVLHTCTLQKLIGQGRASAVFLAQQSRPKRQAAVKVLLPMMPCNPDELAVFLERFRRETDVMAALEHPNIMPIYEYGEYDGLPYLVMPYISGGTLRDVLGCEGPLPLAKAAGYLKQLAAAIDYAHNRGIIHRDIKPANIMVRPEGKLLLGDFGLVKIITEGQPAMIRLTGAGAPVGTPDYMAPEQVLGDDVDTRADLYSLGILLFQLVTGTTPFRGETPVQIAAQHLRLPPPSPLMLRPDLPIQTEHVIKRAMAKKPADRYLHANDLAIEFHQALLDAGIILDSGSTETVLPPTVLVPSGMSTTVNRPRGLFDPLWHRSGQDLASRFDGHRHSQKFKPDSPVTPTRRNMNLPSSQTSLIILLGASEWPDAPEFQDSLAFANSANKIKQYFLASSGFGLPEENLLDLFNIKQSPDDIDREIGQFLDLRSLKMRQSGNIPKDLLVYFIGHGGFVGSESDFYLAIHRTRTSNLMASGIHVVSLAHTLKEKARFLRRIIVLDCCFAGAAFRAFQSNPAQIAIIKAIDAFDAKEKGSGEIPERGTSLLCSSGHKTPSLLSPDGNYTMFSKALLQALHTGNAYLKKNLSLRDLAKLTADILHSTSNASAPRPEVHSPDQSQGDIADIPFFPNSRWPLCYM